MMFLFALLAAIAAVARPVDLLKLPLEERCDLAASALHTPLSTRAEHATWTLGESTCAKEIASSNGKLLVRVLAPVGKDNSRDLFRRGETCDWPQAKVVVGERRAKVGEVTGVVLIWLGDRDVPAVDAGVPQESWPFRSGVDITSTDEGVYVSPCGVINGVVMRTDRRWTARPLNKPRPSRGGD